MSEIIKNDEPKSKDEIKNSETNSDSDNESSDNDNDSSSDSDYEKEEKTTEKKELVNESTISLQLGDVIKIQYNSENKDEEGEEEPKLDDTFIVDYIDKSKIKLIDTKTYEILVLPIKKDGSLANASIKGIILLSRLDFPGYAKQNRLLPNTWITIYFGGDIPSTVTGQITNLEEDMIEIKTFPDKDIIYINFDYKGIPEDIPIENIEIRQPPEQYKTLLTKLGVPVPEEELEKKGEKTVGEKLIEEIKETVAEDEYIPIEEPSVKDNIRLFLLKADDIEFGEEEEFGPISQFVEIEQSKQRFSIEMQTNDLLNEMLSIIPTTQRTASVLNNIHTMIERFKQLRIQFSVFDQNRNIEGPIIKTANWRPLIKELMNFDHLLYWLLPVVKNVKKIYGKATDYTDIQIINEMEELAKMEQIFKNYKSNNFPDEQNKYVALIHELNPSMTPFESVDPENIQDVIYEKAVNMAHINCIVDNLGDFYSSVAKVESVANKQEKEETKRFLFQTYDSGLEKLVATQFNGGRMIAKRAILTQPDEMYIKSFLFMPESIVRFSKINLPCTNILDRANLNEQFLNYWQFLRKNTNVNNVVVDEQYNKQTSNKQGKYEIDDVNKIDEDLIKLEEPFLSTITNYICVLKNEEQQDQDQTISDKTKIYENYLGKIIPQTKVLFDLMKKHINGVVTFVDTILFLEPFLIYTDDLTYQQYKEINKFLNEKISS